MSSTGVSKSARRKPRQARARATVDAIIEGAARVFRREGWSATTNRIAEEAGVSIGSLYEYFPDKAALLLALAERHVDEAETALRRLLDTPLPTVDLLAQLQAALISCQRYPSHALDLVSSTEQAGVELRARAIALERAVVGELTARARASNLSEPDLRARACFAAIGPLTVRAAFEAPAEADGLARHYLAMAASHLGE